MINHWYLPHISFLSECTKVARGYHFVCIFMKLCSQAQKMCAHFERFAWDSSSSIWFMWLSLVSQDLLCYIKCPLCTAWVASNFLGPQIHCLRFSPIVFSLGVFSHHLIIQFHICCKQEITLISDFLPQITLKRFLKLPGLKSLHYSRPWPLTVLLVSERRAPCASKPLGPGHPTALHSGPAESSTRRSPTPRRALVSS